MTAYEIPGQRIPLVAGADLSANQYLAVTTNTDGNIVTASADAIITGVVQLPGISGECLPVMINGVTFGILGATVANGAKVSTDANGKFITAATGPVVGICLFGGDANALGSILLK